MGIFEALYTFLKQSVHLSQDWIVDFDSVYGCSVDVKNTRTLTAGIDVSAQDFVIVI